jgi:hypothetical protein
MKVSDISGSRVIYNYMNGTYMGALHTATKCKAEISVSIKQTLSVKPNIVRYHTDDVH